MTVAGAESREGRLLLGNAHLQLAYDPAAARFSVERPGADAPWIAGAGWRVTCAPAGHAPAALVPGSRGQTVEEVAVTGVHGAGRQLAVTHATALDGVTLTFVAEVYDERPFLLLRVIVANRDTQPVAVRAVELVAGGRVGLGRPGRGLDFFKVGWHGWAYAGLRHAGQRDVAGLLRFIAGPVHANPTTPVPLRRGEFWGEGWGILSDGATALVAGFISQADQFGQVHVDTRPGRAALTLVAQGDGVALRPGEDFRSEWGYLQAVPLPHPDPAGEYVEATARQMRARVPAAPPPAKWTHWYHYFQAVTEEQFVENLDRMRALRPVVPFATAQLDDGYQSAWGDWRTFNAKFPSGLAALARRVRAAGFDAGLWLAPFVADPRGRTAREHPDWFVRAPGGRPVDAGYFGDFRALALDLTHPAALDHVRSLLDTVAHEWGFRFVKTDFLYAGALPGVRHDATRTRAQALRQGLEAIRAGLGGETFLLGCGCPFGPAIGLVDAMRIGPDTAPEWDPYLWNMAWATPVLRGEMSLPSLRNNVRHTLNLSALHRRWWWNDPDCLLVRDSGTQLTPDEVRSAVTLAGLSGGLVIDSDDLARVPPERQAWLAAVVPILAERGYPLDLLEREMAEWYHVPMRRAWGTWHLVAAFNWSDRPARPRLDLARLGLDGAAPLHVFEFWERAYRLHRGAVLDAGEVPPHGCRLLRLCAAGADPCVVGTTLHLTQGGEIDDWHTAGGAAGFTLADLGRQARGEVWIAGLGDDPPVATAGGAGVAVRRRSDGVWALEVSAPARVVLRTG